MKKKKKKPGTPNIEQTARKPTLIQPSPLLLADSASALSPPFVLQSTTIWLLPHHSANPALEK